MSRERDSSRKRSPSKLPECMKKAQQFFAEGNLVPDSEDPGKFLISGDMLLPESRQFRVRFEIKANINDVNLQTTEGSSNASPARSSRNSTPSRRSRSRTRSKSTSRHLSRESQNETNENVALTNRQQGTDNRPEQTSESRQIQITSEQVTDSRPEQANENRVGKLEQATDGTPPDRRVSWKIPTTVRRKLEFSTSPSASPSLNDQSSEPQQSTSTPIKDQRQSISSLSPSTIASEPIATSPTLPEPSITAAESLEGDVQLENESDESDRGRRVQNAIKSGRVTVNRRGRKGTKGKSRTTSNKKAGLIFPSTKIGRRLKEMTGKRCFKTANVALAAVLQTITGDLLEIAGEQTKDDKRTIIQPRDIKVAVAEDDEFEVMFRNVHVPLNPPRSKG